MIRWLNLTLLLASAVALVGVYGLKFQSEGTAAERAALERKIAAQQQQLSMLKADWAVLLQPGHIEPIVNRHAEALQLAVISPEQYKTFDDLPMRPDNLDAAALTQFLEAIESGVDPIAALIEAN